MPSKKIFKVLLGISLAILALYLGKMFLMYFFMSFGTIVSLLITPIMLGYIYA